MVPMTSLWLPILVSAIVVFVASSIMHMVLPYHHSDIRKVPREDDVLEALRRFNLPPGDYGMPLPASPAAMRSPEYIAKAKAGPLVFMTVAPGAPPSMTSNLILWFLYALVVSAAAAYVAGQAVPPGAQGSAVFRFACTAAFLGYSLALVQHSIWYRRNWGTTVKSMIDGVVYALLTAAVFAALWPR